MSFILDALKKIEEKRRSEDVPDLMTIHGVEKEKTKRAFLVYLPAAALLLNAVILAVWLFRPQQYNTAGPAARGSTDRTEEGTTAGQIDIKPAPASGRKVIKEAPEPTIAVDKSPVEAKAALPLTPTPEELRALKTSIAEEKITATAAAEEEPEPEIEENVATETDSTVLDMSRLPSAIREVLPDLAVRGHIYSNDPMSRIVNINGNIIHEGESVAPGLKVNEITITGIVFDYNGTLFSLRAF